MHWIPDGDERRCPEHDKRFALGMPCPDCVTAEIPPPEAIEAAGADLELEEYEGEVRAFAIGARKAAIALLSGDAEKEIEPSPVVAAKWADVYLKSMRLVGEMRDRRMVREDDIREMEHEREMSGLDKLDGGRRSAH